jgi:hypothetical protein
LPIEFGVGVILKEVGERGLCVKILKFKPFEEMAFPVILESFVILSKYLRKTILCKIDVRPRLHETGTKSNRDHFVSVIVLFITDVYMRPGRK